MFLIGYDGVHANNCLRGNIVSHLLSDLTAVRNKLFDFNVLYYNLESECFYF